MLDDTKACFRMALSWLTYSITNCAAAVQARLSMLRALAALWGLSEEQVQQYTALNKPSMHLSQTEVFIGRAVLPMLVSQSQQFSPATPANSNKVCQLMPQYAMCASSFIVGTLCVYTVLPLCLYVHI